MKDLYLITQAKDKQIEELTNKLARKDEIIQAQKQALDFLWSRLEEKQLDRQKEHSRQMKLKL